MKKLELINLLSEETRLQKKDVEAVLEAFGNVVLDVIAKNDSVKFADVCTFKGVDKPARKARNPKTGEYIDIPAKTGAPKAVFTKTAKE